MSYTLLENVNVALIAAEHTCNNQFLQRKLIFKVFLAAGRQLLSFDTVLFFSIGTLRVRSFIIANLPSYITSHHMENTEAGLQRPLFLRNRLKTTSI